MQNKRDICERFIKNSRINPTTGGKLVYDKGPYNSYIRLCEQLGYDVNHLKAEVIVPEIKELPIIKEESLWSWMVGEQEFPIPITYPVNKKYKLSAIKQWRDKIADVSGINPNASSFNELDLYNLYDLYNKYFFNSVLPRITLQISGNLTKTAGKCQTISNEKQCQYTIFISKPIFANLNLKEKQSTKSGGIECYSRLECLQLVLEHEMIHLAIRITYPDAKQRDRTIYKSHGLLFKDLVYAYFGQTKTTHQIGQIYEANSIENNDFVSEEKIVIGSPVSFLSKSVLKKGIVTDIFPVNTIVLFLDGDNMKINHDLLNNVDKNDKDYPALLKLKSELNDKLLYLNRLNIGDQVKYLDKGKIEERSVVKTYPKSNAVGVRIENLIYKIHYSFLILSSTSVVRSAPSPPKLGRKDQLHVGDKVRTNNGGKVVVGVIIKKNPVNAVVRDEQNKEWSINYTILDLI